MTVATKVFEQEAGGRTMWCALVDGGDGRWVSLGTFSSEASARTAVAANLSQIIEAQERHEHNADGFVHNFTSTK